MLTARSLVKVLTVPEFATAFGVSRKTVVRWLDLGYVPGAFRTLGDLGHYRIPVESLTELLRAGHSPADPVARAELIDELARRKAESW